MGKSTASSLVRKPDLFFLPGTEFLLSTKVSLPLSLSVVNTKTNKVEVKTSTLRTSEHQNKTAEGTDSNSG